MRPKHGVCEVIYVDSDVFPVRSCLKGINPICVGFTATRHHGVIRLFQILVLHQPVLYALEEWGG